MQTEQTKSRFGRCPYCRAMIYQDLSAIIFYCSKCRTPIRGKNPHPTDETEYALAQLEILSTDTASVFSDDADPPNPSPAWPIEDDDDDDDGGPRRPHPQLQSRSAATGRSSFPPGRQPAGAAPSSSYRDRDREFGSVRTAPNPRTGGGGGGALSSSDLNPAAERSASPLHSRVTQLRPASRRTRRSSTGGDADNAGSGTESDSDAPATATRSYYAARRSSPLSSQELDAATALSSSGFELEPPADLTKTPLSDPAFQQDLLQALDNLRRLIAAVDHPRSIDGLHWHGAGKTATMHRPTASCCHDAGGEGKRTITRRSSRLMRRLESQLTRALPVTDRPRCRDATASASSSSSSSATTSSRRGGGGARAAARREKQCRPVLGGTPFVVCDGCSEVLRLPPGLLPAGRVFRLRCGGCGEAFELTLPAIGPTTDLDLLPKRIFSAPQTAVSGDGEDVEVARSNLSGEQPRPAGGPLHRVLGYSSVSSVLRSRRHDEYS